MHPTTLIFIDFDGVLHPLNEGPPREWRMIRQRRDFFHPEPVNRLLGLCERCNAGLVVASAWRLDFTVEQFNEVFRGRVIGLTPFLEDDRGTATGAAIEPRRFREVQAFRQAHAALNVLPWIVFDDQAKHYPRLDNLFITDPRTLLTDALIDAAQGYLHGSSA